MKLDKILEYQVIDKEIHKAEVALNKSDVSRKAQEYKKSFMQAQQELINMDKETADTFREIERIETLLAGYISEKRTDLSYDNLTVIKQVDNLTSTLVSYQEQIIALEKDGQKAFRKLKDLTTQANRKYAQATGIRAELLKVNAELVDKQKEIKVQFSKEFDTLNALKAEISEEVFTKYTELRKKRRLPAFVPVSSGALNCNGCGMELSNAATDKLGKQGDIAECPNCGRILFVE